MSIYMLFCSAHTKAPAPNRTIPSNDLAAFIDLKSSLKLHFFLGPKHKDNKLPHSESHNKPPDVRIVFLLTLNGRALRHIRRLLKLIFRPRHYYYIHIDEVSFRRTANFRYKLIFFEWFLFRQQRQSYLPRSLRWLERNFTNVRLAKTRFPTMWGGTTLLTMFLKSLEDLLNTEEWKWDFMMNLSESDFPVKYVKPLQGLPFLVIIQRNLHSQYISHWSQVKLIYVLFFSVLELSLIIHRWH